MREREEIKLPALKTGKNIRVGCGREIKDISDRKCALVKHGVQ